MPHQQLGGRFLDLGNPQRIDESVETDVAPGVDRGDELARAGFSPSLPFLDLLGLDAEDVGRGLDQLVLPELGDVPLAYALDIKRISGNKMPEPLHRLGRAGDI